MRVAKICLPVDQPTLLISPKLSGPEVVLTSGDYCSSFFSLIQFPSERELMRQPQIGTNV